MLKSDDIERVRTCIAVSFAWSWCRLSVISGQTIAGQNQPLSAHLKAERMAAPTNAANVKKALANSEPSTHGTSRHLPHRNIFGRYRTNNGQPAARGPNWSAAI